MSDSFQQFLALERRHLKIKFKKVAFELCF